MIKVLLALVFSISSFTLCNGNPIQLEVFRGQEIKKYVSEFASLCHTIYAEYPYLYDGEHAGYETYINSYGDLPNSILCLAFDGDQVVGACSGMPLSESREDYQGPFLKENIDIHHFFYISELILLPDYRRKGIGENLYANIEDIVRKEKLYSAITCCNIQVAKDDPNMPKDYRYIDYPLWIKLGFNKYPHLSYDSYWVNVGEKDDSPHHLVFWIKNLKD